MKLTEDQKEKVLSLVRAHMLHKRANCSQELHTMNGAADALKHDESVKERFGKELVTELLKIEGEPPSMGCSNYSLQITLMKDPWKFYHSLIALLESL